MAAAARARGRLYFDLEFVSEARYIPELALFQAAWESGDGGEEVSVPAADGGTDRVAAVDPLAVDPLPLVELVADPGVEVVVHAAQGDLSLLGDRFGIAARAVVDTQIAAAFVGLGEQIGYAALVGELLDVALDKSSQFTDWSRRPLAPTQVSYALDDVRYLPEVWRRLESRLVELGRLAWVREESASLAAAAARRPEPEEAFRRFRGWERLDPRTLGALSAAAAWRERQALAGNTPPRWLVPDQALVEASRRRPKRPRELTAIRGIGEATARRFGPDLLAAIERGAAQPIEPPHRQRLGERGKALVGRLTELVSRRSAELGIAQRFLATRADLETLVRDRLAGVPAEAAPPPLTTGWRREVVGERVEAEIAAALEG